MHIINIEQTGDLLILTNSLLGEFALCCGLPSTKRLSRKVPDE
jgi:hypothetical protein